MLNFLTNFFAGIALSVQMLFGIHSAPVSNPISTSTVATSTSEHVGSQSTSRNSSVQTAQKTAVQTGIVSATSNPAAKVNVQTQTTTQSTSVTVSSSAALSGMVDPSSLNAITPAPTITGSSNAEYVQILGTLPADPLTGTMISSQAIPVINGRWSFSVGSNPGPLGSTSLCNGVYNLQLSGIANASTTLENITLENTTFTVNAPGNTTICTSPTHL